jgi:hypothetical protein
MIFHCMNGGHVPGTSGRTAPVFNPSTGQVAATSKKNRHVVE